MAARVKGLIHKEKMWTSQMSALPTETLLYTVSVGCGLPILYHAKKDIFSKHLNDGKMVPFTRLKALKRMGSQIPEIPLIL